MLLALVACSSSSSKPTAVPIDAAPMPVAMPTDASIDAPAFELPRLGAPLYCRSSEAGKGGSIEIVIDAQTLRGSLERFTAGPAPRRRIRVTAKSAGNTTVLLFAGYIRDDSTNQRGVAKPRPTGERLVVGKSIVARMVNVGAHTKLFLDGDVDFKTGARPIIEDDGSSPCHERRG